MTKEKIINELEALGYKNSPNIINRSMKSYMIQFDIFILFHWDSKKSAWQFLYDCNNSTYSIPDCSEISYHTITLENLILKYNNQEVIPPL